MAAECEKSPSRRKSRSQDPPPFSPPSKSSFRRPTFYVLVRIPYATEIIFWHIGLPLKAMNSSRKGHLYPSLCPKHTDSSWFSASVQKCLLNLRMTSPELSTFSAWTSGVDKQRHFGKQSRHGEGTLENCPVFLRTFWMGRPLPALFHLIPALLFNTCGHQSPHCTCRVPQLPLENQWGPCPLVVNQASLRIWKQQPELLIIKSLKEYSQRTLTR